MSEATTPSTDVINSNDVQTKSGIEASRRAISQQRAPTSGTLGEHPWPVPAHVSGEHDQAILLCHELYWRNLLRYHRQPSRLAEWCHLLISNREENQTWNRLCRNITGCLLARRLKPVPVEARCGLFLSDGTAYGPGYQRILSDLLDKYMRDSEIANYIFESGGRWILCYMLNGKNKAADLNS